MDRSKLLTRPIAVLVALTLQASPALAFDKLPIKGQASVIDGDSIEIEGRRIRLHGIDAPDGRQSCKDAAGKSYPCGQRAASALADKITSRTIRCNPKSTDSSGSKVAVCWLDNVNLNIWMVSQGWAIADRSGSANYMPWENEARKAKRGLWAGTFTEPSEWRRSQQRQRPGQNRP